MPAHITRAGASFRDPVHRFIRKVPLFGVFRVSVGTGARRLPEGAGNPAPSYSLGSTLARCLPELRVQSPESRVQSPKARVPGPESRVQSTEYMGPCMGPCTVYRVCTWARVRTPGCPGYTGAAQRHLLAHCSSCSVQREQATRAHWATQARSVSRNPVNKAQVKN